MGTNINNSMICLFCKKNETDSAEHALTEEHVIPKVLGGWITLPVVCKKCNNTIGHKVEARLKKNAFIVAALDKLKIQPSNEAFKNAKFKLTLDDKYSVSAKPKPNGKHEIIPTKQPDNSLIVGEEKGKEVLKKLIQRYEKEHNVKIDFDLDLYDFLPYGILIPVNGTDICFIKHENKKSSLMINNLTEPIPFLIPAKIALLHFSGFLYPLVISDRFDLMRNSILNDDLFGKVTSNSLLNRVDNPRSIDYGNYHFIRYSIIDEDLIALIGIFSTIIFTVYLGNLNNIKLSNEVMSIFDIYHIYDLKNKNLFSDQAPDDALEQHNTFMKTMQIFANYELNKKK